MSRFNLGILFFILAAAAVYFLIMPAWDRVAVLRGEIRAVQDLSAQLIELGNVADALQQEYNAIPETDLEKLKSIAPKTAATAGVLGDFESIAAKNAVRLRAIDFKGAAAGQAKTSLALSAQSRFSPIPVTLQLVGTYESLRSFLIDLEHNLRLVDVKEINFRPGSESTSPISVSAQMYYRR